MYWAYYFIHFNLSTRESGDVCVLYMQVVLGQIGPTPRLYSLKCLLQTKEGATLVSPERGHIN